MTFNVEVSVAFVSITAHFCGLHVSGLEGDWKKGLHYGCIVKIQQVEVLTT